MFGLAKTGPAPGLEIIEVSCPQPGPGEVLLQSKACGICGGDLHLYHGSEYVSKITGDHFPRIIGHEFGGEIVEVGPYVAGLVPGDRVAVEPTPGCGTCANCLKGRPNICNNWFVIGMTRDGGMAEYARVPACAVHKVPKSIPDRELPLLETLGVGLHALERMPIGPGDAVAVIGAGSVGLLLTQALQLAGAKPLIVTGTSRSQRRLRLAEQLGADFAIAADQGDIVAQVKEATGGDGVDYVFEVAGQPSALDQATRIIRRGGKIAAAGCTDEAWSWKPFSAARWGEIDFIFCRGRTAETWRRSIHLVDASLVKLSPIVDLVLPLSRALEGFARLEADRDVVKVVILPG